MNSGAACLRPGGSHEATGDAEPALAARRRQPREGAVEPAVALRRLRREAALHQILRVEMRARAVAVAGGVDEQQLARLVIGMDRRQRRVEREHAVELQAAVGLADRRQGEAAA